MEFVCEVCGKEAEFESPANLCEYHWKLWWYSGLFRDEGEPTEFVLIMEKVLAELFIKD